VGIHPADGSAAFAADATFRRVAGLADAAALSFQLCNFPNRYRPAFQLPAAARPDQHRHGGAGATFQITS
jgi:hypothetical protein